MAATAMANAQSFTDHLDGGQRFIGDRLGAP